MILTKVACRTAGGHPIWYARGLVGMLPGLQLNPASDVPLYRQLYVHVKQCIETGALRAGERLPPTRDLAAQLGLNRTTVAAAWELLEGEGLIKGHVGRGSFVAGGAPAPGLSWDTLLPEQERGLAVAPVEYSFAASRPSSLLFPMEAFRESCREVTASDEAQILLQLGAPAGYRPLREYLLDQGRDEGVVRDGDEVLNTSGCQQAFDLIQRVLVSNGET